MQSRTKAIVVAVVVAVVAAAVVVWMNRPEPSPPQAQPAPPSPPASAVPPPVAVPAEPAIEHPIETPATATPLTPPELGPALSELVGRKAVLSFLQTDDFPRRFVATVDNLGRAHAPPALWPVNPTPDRFTVDETPDGPVIGADNSARYTPLVLLAETVAIGPLVDLYVRMYPLLQQAYEELGFPRRHFNDRLFEVIDQLLATPQASYPLKLQLLEVKGPVPSLRPWVRYQYADPALESLTAGQKILLRVGPVNQRRLKAKLAEIRQELASRAPKR